MSKEQEQSMEPVDRASDNEFMDTGVLHEKPKSAKGVRSGKVVLDKTQDVSK